MNFSKFYLTLLITLFSLGISAQQQNEKAVEIINKSLEAMGGKEFIKSINSLYTNSANKMEGRDVNWIIKEMLPNLGSFEIVYQNRIVYKSFYDGKLGYDINNGEKKLADQENFKDKAFKKNIFNELDYLDASLYKLEYVGVEDVGTIKCDKIKAALINNSKIVFLFFDKSSSFLIKSDTVNGEKESFSTVLHGDFKKFGKLTYFTTMKFGTSAASQSAKIIELFYNEKINISDFK